MFDPKKEVIERFVFARRLFSCDIQAMPAEKLTVTCGGESRCAFDLMFELVGFFDGLAKLLAHGPSPLQGPQAVWVRAPQEFCNKEQALSALEGAADRLTYALMDYEGDFVADAFPSPAGDFTPYTIASYAIWHTMYHSGQLNYIQTTYGDAALHWVL